jgi:hypothetical protein
MKFLLIAFLLAVQTSYSQVEPSAISFIENLIRKDQPAGQIFYTDKINPTYLLKIKTHLSKKYISGENNETKQNTIVLTRQEKKYLWEQFESFNKPYWTENLFSNSRLVKADSLMAFIRKANSDYSESLNNPNNSGYDKANMMKNYQRPNVFQFSKPVYLRNNSICLIFLSYSCGDPCGRDELCFYKKEKDNWTKWIVVSSKEF